MLVNGSLQTIPKGMVASKICTRGSRTNHPRKEFPAKCLALRSKWNADADVSKSLKPGGTERSEVLKLRSLKFECSSSVRSVPPGEEVDSSSETINRFGLIV